MAMTATRPRVDDTTEYLTTPQIAETFGVSLGRIVYTILKHRLDPDFVAGRCRLYRASRLDEFAAALGLGAHHVAD